MSAFAVAIAAVASSVLAGFLFVRTRSFLVVPVYAASVSAVLYGIKVLTSPPPSALCLPHKDLSLVVPGFSGAVAAFVALAPAFGLDAVLRGRRRAGKH